MRATARSRHADAAALHPGLGYTLLVHPRRTGVLPEEFRPRIFNAKRPASMHTSWSTARSCVRLEPFRRLTRTERTDLEEEGERLAAFHA